MSFSNISFILHKPQLSENIGACARALKNFNFKKLVIINPKPVFPNDKIIATSVGAKEIIKKDDELILVSVVQVYKPYNPFTAIAVDFDWQILEEANEAAETVANNLLYDIKKEILAKPICASVKAITRRGDPKTAILEIADEENVC